MSNLWPKKRSRSLKNFEQWSLTREFLRQYLTENEMAIKKKRLQEVVANEKWSLEES